MGEFESLQGRHSVGLIRKAGRSGAARFCCSHALDYNCAVTKRIFLVILLPLLLSACDFRAGVSSSSTATPFIITATLPPTVVPSATLTPIPATLTPTTTPVQGITTTQVNVRGQPATTGDSLGMLGPSTTVQIVGTDPDNNWYEILYSQGPNGVGWVSEQFVNVAANKDKIPVIGAPATPTAESSTPAAGATSGPTASGTVIQQVNVRNGPGTSFDSVGTLNPNDTVTLTGKDPSGQWYQIQYAAAPDGKGWVAASFIQATGTDNLPIVGSAGSIIGTGTPVAAATVATPTPAPAFADQDSSQVPAADVAFSAPGAQTLLYSSDLSAPQGDPQDWVRFTPSAPKIFLRLNCSGNSGLAIQVTQDRTSVPGSDGLSCGLTKTLQLSAGKAYLVQLSLAASGPPLSYVHYTLEIKEMP